MHRRPDYASVLIFAAAFVIGVVIAAACLSAPPLVRGADLGTARMPVPAVAMPVAPALVYQRDHICRVCGRQVLAISGPGPVAGSHRHVCPVDGAAFWHYDPPVRNVTVNPAGGRWRWMGR